jgi:hypothetical protein
MYFALALLVTVMACLVVPGVAVPYILPLYCGTIRSKMHAAMQNLTFLPAILITPPDTFSEPRDLS